MTEETKGEKAVFKLHDEMQPRFWQSEGVLQDGLRAKLLAITVKYIEYLKLPEHTKISDITFTGSLAGYNYTEYSDVDIHVILDYKQLSEDTDFIMNYFMSMKNLWSETHEVTVFGYPVELFAQNVDEYLDSPGAQYSLVKQDWIKKPEKSPDSINKKLILRKAQELQDNIEDLLKEDPSEDLLRDIDILKTKIRNMRQAGLEDGGEFSPENLTFKILRNNGYLEKLSSLSSKAQNELLSVEESHSI